ncbi:hypothetical protein J6590_060855 [Homalodisca vitripennis]|nr:hypothetical protein J6590_060855 [Homalodisca vitripennis]
MGCPAPQLSWANLLHGCRHCYLLSIRLKSVRSGAGTRHWLVAEPGVGAGGTPLTSRSGTADLHPSRPAHRHRLWYALSATRRPPSTPTAAATHRLTAFGMQTPRRDARRLPRPRLLHTVSPPLVCTLRDATPAVYPDRGCYTPSHRLWYADSATRRSPSTPTAAATHRLGSRPLPDSDSTAIDCFVSEVCLQTAGDGPVVTHPLLEGKLRLITSFLGTEVAAPGMPS